MLPKAQESTRLWIRPDSSSVGEVTLVTLWIKSLRLKTPGPAAAYERHGSHLKEVDLYS